MPPRPLNPAKPAIYLDQSALSDAIRSCLLEERLRPESPAYSDLFSWVNRVASEANLCLSSTHILETAAWSEAEPMAAWLDGLETVWLRSYPDVQRDEDEELVRRIAGVANVEPTNPFAGSFLASFRADSLAKNLPELLRDPSLVVAVRGARDRPPTGEREFMPGFLTALRHDRVRARDEGISEKQLRDGIARKWRSGLCVRAVEAHQRLVSHDRAYIATGSTEASVQQPFVNGYEQDVQVLRVTRVIRAYTEGFERETAAQQPGSNAAKKRHAGGFLDLAHAATPAAYCDVFTCDEFTARCLGDVRAQWGLEPPLAKRRDESHVEFVAKVIATWP